MGLDSVEIILLWEESLGVNITEAEAGKLLTPRTAIDLLAAKLDAKSETEGSCLTLRAFNRLRHAISTGAGVPRREIRRSARLRDFIPRRNRHAKWQAVQGASGIPSLPSLSWGVGLCFAPITVGDLTQWLVAHAARALKSPHEHWTRSEIRTVVRTAITEVCGARAFSDDAHFIRDIRID